MPEKQSLPIEQIAQADFHSGNHVMRCPLYPRKRTFGSLLRHKRTLLSRRARLRTPGLIIYTAICAVPITGGRMRNQAFIFVALLLSSCGSHTTSVDGARSQYLEAVKEYQACMKPTSGEVINNCEPQRRVTETAEQAYKDAMSSGAQEGTPAAAPPAARP